MHRAFNLIRSLFTLLLLLAFGLNANSQVTNPKYALKLKQGNFLAEEVSPGDLIHDVDPLEVINGRYYRLIQFDRIPFNNEKKQLESLGLKFQGYIPNFAYYVSVAENFDLSNLDNYPVRAFLTIIPNFKLHPFVMNSAMPDWAVASPDEYDITLAYHSDIDYAYVETKLNKKGLQILEHDEEGSWVSVRVNYLKAKDLANFNWVQYVEPAGEPGVPEGTNDLRGRTLHRSNDLDSPLPNGYHYTGSGVSVGLNDDGYAGPHIDFEGRTDQSDVAGDFFGDHGDMTGGILGGAGNLDPTMQGMARGAFIYVRQYSQSTTAVTSMHQNQKVMIWSTSYSNGCNAGYTSIARSVDQRINNNPTMIEVFSAGNSNGQNCGYGAGSNWGNVTGGHKVAKNVIAVANLNAADVPDNSSSKGPAEDGRLKPDISANGLGQWSTDPNNTYAVGGGTSAACPGIAGVMAQLYQAYRDLNSNADPNSALMKGVMLNTADDLGNKGPDFLYGWGRVNGVRAVKCLEDGRYLTDTISQGGLNSHNIVIPAGKAEVRFMLIWMDPEASTGAAPALINDLDLTVQDPSAGTHDPYLLDYTPSASALATPAVNGRDSMNNMEQVAIDSAAGGTYVIKVDGHAIPNGPQRYYIVWEYEEFGPTVTYPNGGEGVVPGETERIRWDAYGNVGTFNVEYSTNGGTSWVSINNNVVGTTRFLNWSVPSAATEDAMVRVTRSGLSDTSDHRFNVIGLPTNINVDFVCPDSIGLSWSLVGGASGYIAHVLGNMYMDSVGTTTGTSITLTGIDPLVEHWYTVTSLVGTDGRGRRQDAIYDAGGIKNCIIANDINVQEILTPSGSIADCYTGAPVSVSVKLKNDGQTAASNFPVYYKFNGGSTVMETYTGSINPGNSTTFTFNQTVTMSNAGTYPISVWADLPSDGNGFNDSIASSATVTNGLVVAPPYTQDFESFPLCGTDPDCESENCNLILGWRNETNGTDDDIDFRTDNNGTFSNGTGPSVDHTFGTNIGKYLYIEASGTCEFKWARMQTPCIDLSDPQMTSATFTFWYHMQGGDIGELHVDIYHNDQWNTDVTLPLIGHQASNWQQRSFSLANYLGDTITVRFRAVTEDDYQGDIAIDDVGVTAIILGQESPFAPQWQVQAYPNPAKGKINVDLAGVRNSNVELKVMNLMMTPVMNTTVEVQNGRVHKELDLSDFAAGVYILQVRAGEETKIVKFEVL